LKMSLAALGLFISDAYGVENTIETTRARRMNAPSAGEKTFGTEH
jgi:hypothetical protein